MAVRGLPAAKTAAGALGGTEAEVQPEMAVVVVVTAAGRFGIELAALPMLISTCFRPEEGATNVGNNLHVSGLARSIDVRYLDQLFGKYGKVSDPPKTHTLF